MPDYTLPLDQLPDPLPIEPLTQPFDVTITPPGSKSITNRAYVLAALADGESKIIRPLHSDDTDALLVALCTLGAEARWDGEDVYIKGVNGRFPRGGSVNLGDGGTPTRFMIACACLAAEPVIIDGSKRMRERPIAEGVDMLRQLGAKIEYIEEEGRLPVRVVPSDDFSGGELTIAKTASSQFVSALLLLGPSLTSKLSLQFSHHITSAKYVLLTIGVMWEWECEVDNDLDAFHGDLEMSTSETWTELSGTIRVTPKRYRARTTTIEPDASSALYWLCAAAAIRHARTVIPDLARYTDQPDAWLMNALESAGAYDTSTDPNEQDGTRRVVVTGGESLRQLSFNGVESPDGVLGIAAIAALADSSSNITGLHTLRVKETDRIAALANELRKVGCKVETTDDSITITPMWRSIHRRDACATDSERAATVRGRSPSDPVIIETYNDHRMAMAFAVLGLVRPGISIRNPACVSKSYPTFWKDFQRLYDSPRTRFDEEKRDNP